MNNSHSRSDFFVIGLAYISFIVLGLPGGMLGVAWPSIQETFGASLDAVGILLLASTIGYLLSSFVSGRVITRWGIGPVLVASSLLATVGLIGYSIAPSWWLMVAIGLVAGLGTGMLDSGMNLHFARKYSARLMNWLHASFGLGAALGPLLINLLLVNDISWRMGYLAVAVMYVLVAVAFFVTLKHWNGSAEKQKTDEAPRKPKADVSIRETLQQPVVWLGIVLFMCIAGSELIVGQWAYPLLNLSRGIEESTAAQWVSLYWASFTAGRVVFGLLGERLNIVSAVRLCILLMIVGGGLVWADLGGGADLIGLIIFGFMLGPTFPLLISMTPERLGEGHATNAIGFQVGAASIGVALLPGLTGVLADRISLETVPVVMVAVAAVMLVLNQVISGHTINQEVQLESV